MRRLLVVFIIPACAIASLVFLLALFNTVPVNAFPAAAEGPAAERPAVEGVRAAADVPSVRDGLPVAEGMLTVDAGSAAGTMPARLEGKRSPRPAARRPASLEPNAPAATLEVQVNYAQDWVAGVTDPQDPSVTVVVTVTNGAGELKADAMVTAETSGDFFVGCNDWWAGECPDIVPGDIVKVYAESLVQEINPIGAIGATLDEAANTVIGEANGDLYSGGDNISCEIWEENGPVIYTTANPSGGFQCDFDLSTPAWDLARGDTVAVRYYEPDGDQVINIIEWPFITVNYAHDWVNGNYVAGRTFVITVTDHFGAVRAVAEVDSDYGYGGGNGEGFSTDWIEWSPERPDIIPYDYVSVAADDGYRNTIEVGEITGNIDSATDEISGTVTANFDPFVPLLVECHPWGAWDAGLHSVPGKSSSALPDGSDHYTCTWDPATEWDMQPGQQIGVLYVEPDWDVIMAAFQEPAAYLQIEKTSDGQPAEGGNFLYHINYWNDGDAPAENVEIIDNVFGALYLSDTSGLPSTGGGAGPIVWDIGTLNPGEGGSFDLFVEVTEPAGSTISNTAELVTTSYTQGEEWERWGYAENEVLANDTHLNVGKWAWTGDPAPDNDFVFSVNVCNNGSTGSTEVTLDDNLQHPAMVLQDWWAQHPGWYQVYWDPGHLIVANPSLPSHTCSEVYMQVYVDPGVVAPGDSLNNLATISAANDIETDDNEAWWWGNANEPHTNLNINKWWNWGQLTPGGRLGYGIGYGNNGNVAVGPIYITDTFPTGTSFVSAWHSDPYGGHNFEPLFVNDDYAVWEIADLPNGHWRDFSIELEVDPGATPGALLENTAEITYLPNEDSHDDNQAAWQEELNGPGPNLRVRKYHNWNDNSQIGYQVQFENIGDVTINDVWITDTLLAGQTWDTWWDMGFDWSRLVGDINVDGNTLSWHFSELNPGDSGWLYFNANVDEPGAPLRWYTNTVEITTPPGDVNPDDNWADTLVFSGPELRRVELWINPYGDSNMWGEAAPGLVVTVTNPFGTQFGAWADPDCGGCWNIDNIGPLVGGDNIVVEAGEGLQPVVVTVPYMDVNVDTAADQVFGQIVPWAERPVEVHGNWPDGFREVPTDGAGNFLDTYPDIPRGGNGYVRFIDEINMAEVIYHRPFYALDLVLEINYGHDWIEGIYEPGHTIWITVTEPDGTSLKGLAELTTDYPPGWDQPGFATWWQGWLGNQPDLLPYDWVYVKVDNGVENAVQIGEIDFNVDYGTDLVSGNLFAPVPDPLVYLECQIWSESGGPNIDDWVDPSGGAIHCDYGGIPWDILPGETVAVSYWESDDDRIINTFDWPHITVSIGPWSGGNRQVWGDNGPSNSLVDVTVNDEFGGFVAGAVTSTDEWGNFDTGDSLPEGSLAFWNVVEVTFENGITDTVTVYPMGGEANPDTDVVTITAAGLPFFSVQLEVCNNQEGWCDWYDLGNIGEAGTIEVDMMADFGFDVMWGQTFHAHMNVWNGHTVRYVWGLAAPELNIQKWHSGNYARPGGVIVYGIQYRNDGNGPAEDVTITDTMPPWLTYAGDTSGLSPDLIDPAGPILWHLGTVQPGEQRSFMVTLHVDPGAPEGSGVIGENCVEITTSSAGDWNPDNNTHCAGPTDVWNDDVEIGVDKWAQPWDPTPGQEFEYNIQWCNHRGAAAGPVVMTDTLPSGTTLLAWWPQNNNEVFWEELAAGPDELVLFAPGLPGDYCEELYLRLLLAPDVPLDTTLENLVVLDVANDVDPSNNWRLQDGAHASTPRHDLWVQKSWSNNSVVVPGGYIGFSIDYSNNGNVETTVRVTDTLPPGVSYSHGWWGGHTPWENEPFPDPTIIGDQLVWDLPAIPVNAGYGFNIELNIDEGAEPIPDLMNCATIAAEGPDDNPADNEECATFPINPPGPNLGVQKWHNWNGDGQLGYQIQFTNIGDQPVGDVWIVDTLPPGTQWDGWWDMGFDWSRLVSGDVIVNGDQLLWNFTDLQPGEQGWIQFNANLDSPGEPLRWYTNTVEITLLPDDTDPGNNYDDDVAFSGAEVEWLEVEAHGTSIRGYAPRGPVVITTPYEEDVLPWDGDFDWGLDNVLLPGDRLTVTAGAGLSPVVVTIPNPFDVEGSSITDRVSGQIDHLNQEWINVDLDDGPVINAQTDNNGLFDVLFPDIPRSGQGTVNYGTQVDYTPVNFYRHWQSPDLILNVGLHNDQVDGRYPLGHTVWITVTASDGATVKGLAELTTHYIDGWDENGFTTDDGWLVEPGQILPGDWVFAKADNGFTSEVQVFGIGGLVDVDTDSISGFVDAPWYIGVYDPMEVECHPWGAWNQGWNDVQIKNSSASADGVTTPYFCQWDPSTEWDVDYGQDIGVWVPDDDGDYVINVFWGEAVELGVWKWHQGNYARPGGVVVYGMYYQNNGFGPAENVQIVDTLPPGTTYYDDTSGFPVTIGAGNVITWDLGTVDRGESGNIWVTLDVAPGLPEGEGAIDENCVAISSSTTPELEPGNEQHCAGPVDVWADDVDLSVHKWAHPGDPTPGQRFRYEVQWCNHRGAAAGPVVLTDTLPAEVTLLDWHAEDEWQQLWTQVSFDGTELVLYAPGLPGDECRRIWLNVELDSQTPLYTTLVNTVSLDLADDVDLDNNWYVDEGAFVSPPRYDLWVGKSRNDGIVVPGGYVGFSIDYSNHSNTETTVRITDTLPAGFSYVEGWWAGSTPWNGDPIPDPTVVGNQLVWDLPAVPVDGHHGINIVLDIGQGVPTGVDLQNCALIAGEGEDSYPVDNESCVTFTVQPPGPNLWVEKWHEWQGDGQLRYHINFANFGDEVASDVWLTDTLPANSQWDGWWDLGFDWGRLVGGDVIVDGDQLLWHFSELYPGDWGWIEFNANVDDPGAPLMSYINTLEISLPPGETAPWDNTFEDTAFSGGEVQWLDLDVFGDHIWGYAPSGPIVITTAYEEVEFPWGGDFDWNMEYPFLPGDLVTVTAGLGQAPLVVEIPAPFDVEASSESDHVWGQIDHLDGVWLEVDLHRGPSTSTPTDSNGYFDVLFPDIPRGGEGVVRYRDRVDYTDVTYHRGWQSPDLFLMVDYGYDRVEGFYEPGHTVWITATESDGTTVKGTAELQTGVFPWWEGGTGFSTDWHGWIGDPPDLVPGDWVYGKVDNGFAGEARVMEISGEVHSMLDSVSGYVSAPWFIAEPSLEVECLPWGAWDEGVGADIKYSSASPDGITSGYHCQWDPDTEWDVAYYQEIFVQALEPDGDLITHPFADDAVDLVVDKGWQNEFARPGGVAMYFVFYENRGNIPAENVQIVDILPEYTSYAGDTSGFAPTIGPGNIITWDLGTVNPGDPVVFRMALDVAADAPLGPDVILPNYVAITTTTSPVINPEDDEAWSPEMGVQNDEVDIGVNKWAWPADPAPGENFFYTIEWCNHRSTAAGPVVMTDTLPAGATLLEWREPEWWLNFWTEVSYDGNELVLYSPGWPGDRCEHIELVMQLDPDLPLGMNLVNEVAVGTTGDVLEDNNHAIDDRATASPPRYDLGIQKRFHNGIFSPGGWGVYQIDYWNEGNISTTVVITEVVPPGLIYDRAWWGGGQENQDEPLPEPEVFGNLLIWELDRVRVGDSRTFHIQFDIAPNVLPGTEFGNCVTIGGEGRDDRPANNESCEQVTANGDGPNAKVVKSHHWPNDELIAYDITFMNVGTEPLYDVLITDTLPISVTATNEPGVDHWSNVHIIDNTANGEWGFVVEELQPGDRGTINFEVLLDDPARMPAFYTNTVEIVAADDIDPEDNIYVDLAGKVADTVLRVTPPLAQLSVGDTITMAVTIENVTDLQAIVLEMSFDPALVEVVDYNPATPDVVEVKPGNCPSADLVLQNAADNETGTIVYDALAFGTPACDGDGVVIEITFRALDGGTTAVQFDTWAPIDPDGFDIPAIAEDGSIEISSLGLLQGQVELQGRRNHSGAEVCAEDGAGNASCMTTGSAGLFSFWLDTGVYTVTVEMATYLGAEKGGMPVAAGSTTSLVKVKLLGGDVDSNGVVDILDLAFMGGRYLSVCGDGVYEGRGDVNADCLIDIRDLAIAGGNYLQSSPVMWP